MLENTSMGNRGNGMPSERIQCALGRIEVHDT